MTFASLCGIGNSVLWMSALDDACIGHRDGLYMCLTLFLKHFDKSEDRCEFLLGRDNENFDRMAVILSALCLPISTSWSRSHISRCNELLSLLDASQNLSTRFHETVALHLLDSLCEALQRACGAEAVAISMMTSLDFVLDRILGRIIYDNNSDTTQRLRDDGTYIVCDKKRTEFIHNIELLMYEKIVNKYLTPTYETKTSIQLDVAAETCHLVLSRCGLTGKAGLGSRKYDLFLTLTSICDRLKTSLNSTMEKIDIALLKHLSQTMGYGFMTAPSKQNFLVVNVDSKAIFDLIPNYLNEHALTLDLSTSIIIFVSTFAHRIETDKRNAWIILDKVSSYIYDRSGMGNESYFCQLLLKTVERLQSSNQSNIYTAEINARTRILSICSRSLRGPGYEGNRIQNLLSVPVEDVKRLHLDAIVSAYEAFLDHSLTLSDDAIIGIAKGCVEEVYCELYSNLRWKMFSLYMVFARKGNQLYTETSPSLSTSPLSRRNILLSTMASKEEADELQEDFMISAQWIPQSLMIDLESWDDEYDDILGDEMITSRFLIWLIGLEILDNAARTDIRNRSHLSSYLERTNALAVIMDLVLTCANFQERDGSKWMAYISFPSIPSEPLSMSQLAALTLFRTFESVPTLMKVWWNDVCPKALQSCIAKFVETKVAPETLKRELDRMKKAENLSDLMISGSNVSREISASYIQDEVSVCD